MSLSTFWFWYPGGKEPTGGLMAVVLILLSGESYPESGEKKRIEFNKTSKLDGMAATMKITM